MIENLEPPLQEVYLSDVSERDKPWDSHRYQSDLISGLYAYSLDADSDSVFLRYAQRISECSRVLDFVLKSSDLGECKLKLQNCHCCRCRHCAICQWRRSLAWRARFYVAVPKIVEAYPTHRFIFLTLTARNCDIEQLRILIDQMTRAWKCLSLCKEFPAVGFVRSMEVTRAKDDQAHPHFHCLLMVSGSYFTTGYLKQTEWRQLWQKSLKVEYEPWVHIQSIKERVTRTGEQLPALQAALTETLKYSVKPSDLIGLADLDEKGYLKKSSKNWFNSDWLRELTMQMHGLRATSLGGIFRKFVCEKEPEDLIHLESDDADPILESDLHMLFGWRPASKRYALNSK